MMYLSSCFEQLQRLIWERRTYPREKTLHVGSFAAEWCLCNSAFDRILKEEFVVRDEGILCFRGDRRSPAELFANGFTFEGSFKEFTRYYIYDGKGSPSFACCMGSLALLAYLPECCCGYASCLFATQCGCILCSYFVRDLGLCAPTKACAMSLMEKNGVSSSSVLSFSKTDLGGLRYPQGTVTEQPGKAGYLYACFLPAPYVDLDKFMKRTYSKIPNPVNDIEVFPLGAPILSSEYIIGAWQLNDETKLAESKFFIRDRTFLNNTHSIKPNTFELNTKSLFAIKSAGSFLSSFTPNELKAQAATIKHIYNLHAKKS